jgi:hypothetical protein
MTLKELFLIAFPKYDVSFVDIVPVINERGVKFTVSFPVDHYLNDIEIRFFRYGDVMCNEQVNMQALTLLHQLLTQRGFLSQ